MVAPKISGPNPWSLCDCYFISKEALCRCGLTKDSEMGRLSQRALDASVCILKEGDPTEAREAT